MSVADLLAIADFGFEVFDQWRSTLVRKDRLMPAYECGCDSVLLLHCADHPDTFGPAAVPATVDPNAPEKTALEKAEERYQKFGADVFARADASVREARGKTVIRGVERLIERVEELRGQRDQLDFLIGFNERRLEAVKAGQFRLMSNGQLKYADAELNQSTIIRGNQVIGVD